MKLVSNFICCSSRCFICFVRERKKCENLVWIEYHLKKWIVLFLFIFLKYVFYVMNVWKNFFVRYRCLQDVFCTLWMSERRLEYVMNDVLSIPEVSTQAYFFLTSPKLEHQSYWCLVNFILLDFLLFGLISLRQWQQINVTKYVQICFFIFLNNSYLHVISYVTSNRVV